MNNLTPRAVVAELDKYIVGQEDAKRAVAIAIRNRHRRQMVKGDLREDIVPKNILMIGPTGVGKTEICRRLAKLVAAPFAKVEASKFTEVGYVGRDVESIIRDLVESAVRMVRAEEHSEVKARAERLAEDRLVDAVHPLPKRKERSQNPFEALFGGGDTREEPTSEEEFSRRYREARAMRDAFRQELLAGGDVMDREVEIEVLDTKTPMVNIFDGASMQEMGLNMQDLLGGLLPKKTKLRRLSVREAKAVLAQEEASKLVDDDSITAKAIQRAERLGIVFLDEMDKIAGRERGSGPDVSREGVQRDLLPIIEGTTVMTKYGPLNTDHILFIGAGAFHVSKPSDLIPELQGRFPIRVELASLGEDDFVRILKEPKNALTRQYQELLLTDGVEVQFTEDGVAEVARMAFLVNESAENIGARRLHTVMEKLLEDVLYRAPDEGLTHVLVDAQLVKERLADLVGDKDVSRYIL